MFRGFPRKQDLPKLRGRPPLLESDAQACEDEAKGHAGVGACMRQ